MNHDETIASAEATGKTGAPRPPFKVLGSSFLRRTALSSLVATLLVALTVAVYWSPLWAGRYLFSGIWALIFYSLKAKRDDKSIISLTPLILKAYLFDGRRWRGLILMGLKLLWMALLFAVCSYWPLAEGQQALDGSALVAGVTTPLIVVVLRVLGTMTPDRKFGAGSGHKPGPAVHKSMEPKA